MSMTGLLIRRPVLSSVISLLILFFGLSSLYKLPIRQFPRMNNTVITVNTSYPGADANIISGFITTPIEAAIASAEGIDYMLSTSTEGLSSIYCYIKLDVDPQVAFTDIMSKVQQTINVLPPESQQPIIVKKSDTSTPLMYISLASEDMNPQQINDYAIRVVQPQLQTIDGVAQVDLLGSQNYAMRIFLNPARMAALSVTAADVYTALANNNYLSSSGSSKGAYIAISIHANTNLTKVDEFKQLIIKSSNHAPVRLKDIAKVELGAEKYETSARFDGKRAVFLAITPSPIANPLTVIEKARQMFPELQKEFPPSLKGTIVYDATDYIRASIREVIHTLFEATLIVILVIYLFLGSVRSVLIPVVTIPLSIIGVCSCILFLGYSLNLLTLLAFVLAIGLVVDDAIVVVENIYRHIEEGQTPFQAALSGASEIGKPIIAMTLTLAAVYAPIGFLNGLTGALFKEFAFTLASAVVISGVIALTLSPMMCSKILKKDPQSGRFAQAIDQFFMRLKDRYHKILHLALDNRAPTLVVAAVVLTILPYLYSQTAKETAPDEDGGFFFVVSNTPEYASINYVEYFTQAFGKIFQSFPETEHYFTINSKIANSGMILKDWDKRKKSQFSLKKPLQDKLDKITGLQSFAVIPPALPGAGTGGTPIQVVIKTTADFKSLLEVSNKLVEKALSSGLFIYVDNTLKINHPQSVLNIDRSKASDLGLNMSNIGSSLSAALSGNYVNYFNLMGRSYKVIPQLDRQFRLDPEQLRNIYLKSASGVMVPLSTVTQISETVEPNSYAHFQQLNAATLQAVMKPGSTLGQGLAYLQEQAKDILPKGFSLDFGGQSRQFMQEGSSLILAFFMAIIVIYLVLSAQYESFRDPLIILISVPMSICGAIIPLNLGLASVNIYTQIGLITLIGLISKHGILIVDFANQLQRHKQLDRRAAVEEAAATRLRPILMTTAAMIFGVLPLLVASGAGAVSRFDIGLVIASGLLFGTLFTLFIVPTMYTYLAEDHHSDETITS